MTLKDRRGSDLRLALVRLTLNGLPPAVLSKKFGLPRWKVWYHLTRAEHAGLIKRHPGTKNPVIFEPGPKLGNLLKTWPDDLLGPLSQSGRGPEGSLPLRVHSVNFKVQILGRPEPPRVDLPWRPLKPWGNCPQFACDIEVDSIGKVELRRIGRTTMAIYTPEFRAGKDDVARMLDILTVRMETVLIHIQKQYGYRFGLLSPLQKTHYAFPIDHSGIRELLLKYKPKNADWFTDSSMGKGTVEIETFKETEAYKILVLPDRVDRLETIVREMQKTQRLDHTTLERLTGVVESLARIQADHHEETSSALARLTFVIQELSHKLEKKGPEWRDV